MAFREMTISVMGNALPPPQPKPNNCDAPVSFLWKGICGLFSGLFNRKEDQTAQLRAKLKAEQNITKCLQKQLEDRDAEVRHLKAFFDAQVKTNVESMKEFLGEYTKERSAERLAELKVLENMFANYETKLADYNRLAGLYEDARRYIESVHGEWKFLKERNEILMESNEALSAMKLEFEERAHIAEEKVRRYEDYLDRMLNGNVGAASLSFCH